jgi:hypothetical protein
MKLGASLAVISCAIANIEASLSASRGGGGFGGGSNPYNVQGIFGGANPFGGQGLPGMPGVGFASQLLGGGGGSISMQSPFGGGSPLGGVGLGGLGGLPQGAMMGGQVLGGQGGIMGGQSFGGQGGMMIGGSADLPPEIAQHLASLGLPVPSNGAMMGGQVLGGQGSIMGGQSFGGQGGMMIGGSADLPPEIAQHLASLGLPVPSNGAMMGGQVLSGQGGMVGGPIPLGGAQTSKMPFSMGGSAELPPEIAQHLASLGIDGSAGGVIDLGLQANGGRAIAIPMTGGMPGISGALGGQAMNQAGGMPSLSGVAGTFGVVDQVAGGMPSFSGATRVPIGAMDNSLPFGTPVPASEVPPEIMQQIEQHLASLGMGGSASGAIDLGLQADGGYAMAFPIAG